MLVSRQGRGSLSHVRGKIGARVARRRFLDDTSMTSDSSTHNKEKRHRFAVKNLLCLSALHVNHSHMDLFLIMQETQPSRRVLKWPKCGSISRPLERGIVIEEYQPLDHCGIDSLGRIKNYIRLLSTGIYMFLACSRHENNYCTLQ